MNAIAFTREVRVLSVAHLRCPVRASKDGRTHCAEHHPSRRGEGAAPQDDAACIAPAEINLDSILLICPSCQCVAAVVLDREGKSPSLLAHPVPPEGRMRIRHENAGRGAMDAKAATDERG